MIERFLQLLIVYVFSFAKNPAKPEIDKEFLQIVKDNFFDSLGGGKSKLVRLESLRGFDLRDLNNMKFFIHGEYSSQGTSYNLVLSKNLEVKHLFVR